MLTATELEMEEARLCRLRTFRPDYSIGQELSLAVLLLRYRRRAGLTDGRLESDLYREPTEPNTEPNPEPTTKPAVCPHEHLASEVLDQTGGVACNDCNTILAYCWDDHHVPESLWNRLAAQDTQAIACEQSREDVCAICEEPITTPSEQDAP